MVEGRALLDHFVGSEKSLSVIIAGMESRRIGISRKNLHVVPNNMIQHWREEFKKAYPSANVLAVTERDFDSSLSRKRLFSRVAANGWDAVIVPHSQFDMLPISPEREAKTVNAQIQEMKDLLREGAETNRPKTRAEKQTTLQIENKIQKYKEKLKELSQGRKDDTTHLRSLIDTGELQPGDQLPPERELARRLNVSRPNLRAGIAFLGMIGVLKICHGTGTYVFFGHGSCHPIPHRCQESSNAPSPRSYLKRVV
jgi:hypothetical protein